MEGRGKAEDTVLVEDLTTQNAKLKRTLHLFHFFISKIRRLLFF